MNFNDIVRNRTLLDTSEAKQIIVDTLARYPFCELARIFGTYAGIESAQSVERLHLLFPLCVISNGREEPNSNPPQLQQLNMTEIENLDLAAPHINENSAPVSETMAQIYAAQGNFEKAIELYDQLCLKNPEKNAYFASQKEKLISLR